MLLRIYVAFVDKSEPDIIEYEHVYTILCLVYIKSRTEGRKSGIF